MADLSDKTIEWLRDHVRSTTESEFQSVLAEVQRYRPAIRNIRQRITALTLMANLPKTVWQELCLIDSALSLLMGKEPGE